MVILWSLPALACAEPRGALPKVRPFPLERVRLLESPFRVEDLKTAYEAREREWTATTRAPRGCGSLERELAE